MEQEYQQEKSKETQEDQFQQQEVETSDSEQEDSNIQQLQRMEIYKQIMEFLKSINKYNSLYIPDRKLLQEEYIDFNELKNIFSIESDKMGEIWTLYINSGLKAEIFNTDIINYLSAVFNFEIDQVVQFQEDRDKLNKFQKSGYICYRMTIYNPNIDNKAEELQILKVEDPQKIQKEKERVRLNKQLFELFKRAMLTLIQVCQTNTQFIKQYIDYAWDNGDSDIQEQCEEFLDDQIKVIINDIRNKDIQLIDNELESAIQEYQESIEKQLNNKIKQLLQQKQEGDIPEEEYNQCVQKIQDILNLGEKTDKAKVSQSQ